MQIRKHIVYISSVIEALTIFVLLFGIINLFSTAIYSNVWVGLSTAETPLPRSRKHKAWSGFFEKKSDSTSKDNS